MHIHIGVKSLAFIGKFLVFHQTFHNLLLFCLSPGGSLKPAAFGIFGIHRSHMGRKMKVMELRNDTFQFWIKMTVSISENQFSVVMYKINLSQIL